MYKYRSVSDFRHSLVIQGKKYMISPGEVVESPSPLTYIFLQQVDEKIPVTLSTPYQSKQVVAVSEVSNTVSNVNNEVSSVKSKLEQFIDKYESDMEDLREQVNKHFADIEVKEGDRVKEYIQFQEMVNRRLGILKDAVRTIEEEVYGDTSSKNS